MSIGKNRFLTILCLLLLAFQTSSQQVTANQLNLPQRHNPSVFFGGGPGNDILVGSDPTYDLLGHEFVLIRGSADHVITNGDLRDQLGGVSTSPFPLWNNEALNHFVNDSADPLEMFFSTDFYDLLMLNGEDVNNTNLVEDVLLPQNEFIGFNIFMQPEDVGQPLAISTQANSPFGAFDVDIHLLTPDRKSVV